MPFKEKFLKKIDEMLDKDLSLPELRELYSMAKGLEEKEDKVEDGLVSLALTLALLGLPAINLKK